MTKVNPMTDAIAPPLKWHGGKHYLAKKIIGLMPARCVNHNKPGVNDPGWLHYVEPYFGGGSVLLANDPEGISEVVNDLNASLTNFWRVLANDAAFGHFRRWVEGMPFSQVEFKTATEDGPISRAATFFVRCRQSLAGRMDAFAGITRNRTRRGMNEQVSAWLNAIEGLPAVHARLRRVLILNRPALDVIRSEDGPRTLFYLDPPYLHETRAAGGEYAHEMTDAQHGELLATLELIRGRFLLSGYRSEMYDLVATNNGWKRHDFELPNNSASGKAKRRMTECVWTNF
jgi:DNA adenine methylase